MVETTQKSLSIKQQLEYISATFSIAIDLEQDKARQYLSNISFCRLKPYFTALHGMNFSRIIKYYDLDRKLRIIILDAIERIEVSIKAVLINRLCEIYDNNPLWYSTTTTFQSLDNHINFDKVINELKSRHRTDRDIKQALKTNTPLPIWTIIEKLSFGDLSKLYSFLQIKDAQVIAQHFNKTPENFKDQLHCLTYIRNLSAHHMNLFDRVMRFKVRGTRQLHIPKDKIDNLCGHLILIKHYVSTIIPTSTWGDKVNNLLKTYQEDHHLLLKYWGINENFVL